MLMKFTVPVAIVGVAVGVLLAASGCRYGDAPADPCAPAGCTLPATGPVADDPAVSVPDCSTTAEKGPCVYWWPDTDDVCRWWYVPVGKQFATGAEDMGVSPDGVECNKVNIDNGWAAD